MARYTGQDIMALARQAGASPSLARIMAGAAMAEGGGDSEAVGDWNPGGRLHVIRPLPD
jgi:hypothetical protein